MCVCVCVLAIVVHGNVPPWLYMHVFFAVGFPKERAFGTLVPRWTHPKTRYSMRSLKSQPNIKMQHTYSTTPAVKAGKIAKNMAKNLGAENLTCPSVFLSSRGLFSPNVQKFVPLSKDRVDKYRVFFFKTLLLQLTLNVDGTDFPPDALWHVCSEFIILDSQWPYCPALRHAKVWRVLTYVIGFTHHRSELHIDFWVKCSFGMTWKPAKLAQKPVLIAYYNLWFVLVYKVSFVST